MSGQRYILTLSCADDVGIVAAVTGKLAETEAFICQSSQFGDFATGQFFMRCEFTCQESFSSPEKIASILKPVAQKFQMRWEVSESRKKPKTLIFVSKSGHCLNDLLHKVQSGNLDLEIAAVVSNHELLKPMVTCHNIPFYHLPLSKDNRATQEEKILQIVENEKIDLLVLARYMQILSPDLCKRLFGKIINIHHSFLPSFKGAKPYHQAYDRGVKIIGATAHYVTEDLDEGPIIDQETTYVSHSHTPKDLIAIGRDIECAVLSRAVKWHAERRILINGNKTIVFKP